MFFSARTRLALCWQPRSGNLTSHSPPLGLRPSAEPATTVISTFINFTMDRDKRVFCFAHSHCQNKKKQK